MCVYTFYEKQDLIFITLFIFFYCFNIPAPRQTPVYSYYNILNIHLDHMLCARSGSTVSSYSMGDTVDVNAHKSGIFHDLFPKYLREISCCVNITKLLCWWHVKAEKLCNDKSYAAEETHGCLIFFFYECASNVISFYTWLDTLIFLI